MRNYLLGTFITAALILGYQATAKQKDPCMDKAVPAEVIKEHPGLVKKPY